MSKGGSYDHSEDLAMLPIIRKISGKILINKLAIKKLLNKLSFGIDVKLYVTPLPYKVNAYNMSGVRS